MYKDEGRLAIVKETVSDHMSDILSLFKPDALITVIVRWDGKPEQDFLMTSDSLNGIADVIGRRASAVLAGDGE